MPRIYRRSSTGSWWTDIGSGSGRIQKSTKTKDKSIALKILADRINKYEARYLPGTISWEAFKQQFLEARKSVSMETQGIDRRALGEIERLCPIQNLSDFGPELLERVKLRWRETGKEKVAANRLFRALKYAMRYAQDMGWSEPKNLSRVKKPYPDPGPRMRYFTVKETYAILDACAKDSILGPLAYLAYFAGLRRSEIRYLKWSDIDFKNTRIVLHPKENWKPKGMRDGDAPKWVPMHPELVQYLISFRHIAEFVLGSAPPSPNVLSHLFADKMKELEIDGTLHTLRHTIASHMVSSGVDLNKVREFMRHSSIAQTLHYAKLAPEAKNSVLDGIPKRPK